jgi:hypothetical protein
VRAGKAPAPRSRKKCAKRSPNYMMKDEAKKRGAMAEYDYDRAKSKSEKGARPALMVDGAQAGTLVWIKTGLDSSGRRGTTQTAGNANATADGAAGGEAGDAGEPAECLGDRAGGGGAGGECGAA